MFCPAPIFNSDLIFNFFFFLLYCSLQIYIVYIQFKKKFFIHAVERWEGILPCCLCTSSWLLRTWQMSLVPPDSLGDTDPGAGVVCTPWPHWHPVNQLKWMFATDHFLFASFFFKQAIRAQIKLPLIGLTWLSQEHLNQRVTTASFLQHICPILWEFEQSLLLQTEAK